ncbi:lipase [Actinocrinis puniceicyclus]|uniref:Lipase n=1 Tax=Actinocrinis puniceicyclus TaxID=977794 RepID=A0A8J7WKI0_9ACTN|nr:GDSL-type esterase/lipase family protein [Actinocrinis puniceicyclus]MBS2963976.1 lipase [Actinocrinis puniceicyclus]
MTEPTATHGTHRAWAVEVTDFAAGPVLLRGALDLERTESGWLPRRLPRWTRAQYPEPGVEDMVVQPSGVRLAFSTAADAIELDVLTTQAVWPGDPVPTRADGFDLVIDSVVRRAGASEVTGALELRDGTGAIAERRPGRVGTVRFDDLGDQPKEIELWLPHHTRVELVALRARAPIRPAAAAGRSQLRWVHHGSSISHCHAALRPTETWPALAARRAGVEVVNLGFGGQAQLDPFTARAIRQLPADLISLKLGINIVNADSFRLRAFIPAVHGFLDTVREGHPKAPLLVVSPIICPPVEDRPGPTIADPGRAQPWFVSSSDPSQTALGRLSLGVIRGTLARIVAERSSQDPNLHYLDGRLLFGPGDVADLPDNLHPNAAGYRRMGERFADLVFGPQGAFGGHPTRQDSAA